MRTEASLDQWGELYAVATRIKDLKPWEFLWDMDLIGVQTGEPEETVFFSIMGKGGGCYGINVYEGYEGLNDFMMVTLQESMNLTVEYAMSHQKCLTCYWGNREELSEKQRKVIKELGYKYRGKDQWLYFMSFLPGFYPYNFDADEVIRMTGYLENLEMVLKYYTEQAVSVDFEHGNMFSAVYDEKKSTWQFGEKELPFSAYQFHNLNIEDEYLLEELAHAPKCELVLEADIACLYSRVDDKAYDRPGSVALCLVAEAVSGMMLKCELQQPGVDKIVSLAEEIIGFICEIGVPKEIRVSNIILEAGLEQICEVCGIKLRRVKKLRACSEFMEGFKRL